MAAIAFCGVSKVFADGHQAITGLDLAVEPGEIVVLMGPSGSGKTTALRLAAGLDQPSAGEVRWEEEVSLPASYRGRVGMVFQGLGLYEHLSARENIAFSLWARESPWSSLISRQLQRWVLPSVQALQKKIDSQVAEVASWLQIEGLLDKAPGELSGGEQQRVALARALVRHPRLLLLDEPFSEVDEPTRRRLRWELVQRLKEVAPSGAAAVVWVTHDWQEAMEVADRIAILSDGHLQDCGSPEKVYNVPATEAAAKLLGLRGMNFLRPKEMAKLTMGFRPEAAEISRVSSSGSHAELSGTFVRRLVLGGTVFVLLENCSAVLDGVQNWIGGQVWLVEREIAATTAGTAVLATVPTSALRWFDDSGKWVRSRG